MLSMAKREPEREFTRLPAKASRPYRIPQSLSLQKGTATRCEIYRAVCKGKPSMAPPPERHCHHLNKSRLHYLNHSPSMATPPERHCRKEEHEDEPEEDVDALNGNAFREALPPEIRDLRIEAAQIRRPQWHRLQRGTATGRRSPT